MCSRLDFKLIFKSCSIKDSAQIYATHLCEEIELRDDPIKSGNIQKTTYSTAPDLPTRSHLQGQIAAERRALFQIPLINRCIHHPLSRCSHFLFLSRFPFSSPICRPEDLPLFLEVVVETNDVTVDTYKYARNRSIYDVKSRRLKGMN